MLVLMRRERESVIIDDDITIIAGCMDNGTVPILIRTTRDVRVFPKETDPQTRAGDGPESPSSARRNGRDESAAELAGLPWKRGDLIFLGGKDWRIVIGGSIEIRITEVCSRRVYLGFDAPKNIAILRGEIYQRFRPNGGRNSDL